MGRGRSMAFLQLAASGEGLRPGLAPASLISCWNCELAEDVESGLGGPADSDRPVAIRNRVAALGLERRLKAAIARVAVDMRKQVRLGTLALLGLLVLQLIRVDYFLRVDSAIPESQAFKGIQTLCVCSDIGCLLVMAPLFAQQFVGRSVIFAHAGPMLTGLFTMSLIDCGAFFAYLILTLRMPVSPGSLRESAAVWFVDALFTSMGVWDLTLLASVGFKVTLCVCSWRIYVSVRQAGLYPAGDPKLNKKDDISILEVFCDAPEAMIP